MKKTQEAEQLLAEAATKAKFLGKKTETFGKVYNDTIQQMVRISPRLLRVANLVLDMYNDALDLSIEVMTVAKDKIMAKKDEAGAMPPPNISPTTKTRRPRKKKEPKHNIN